MPRGSCDQSHAPQLHSGVGGRQFEPCLKTLILGIFLVQAAFPGMEKLLAPKISQVIKALDNLSLPLGNFGAQLVQGCSKGKPQT